MRFRSASDLSWIMSLANQYDLQEHVEVCGSVDFKAAVTEMCSVDGLLLFQGANCDQQVPAKAYEYLCTGKPVMTLCGEQGATAQLLNSWGLGPVVEIDNTQQIADAIELFVNNAKTFESPVSQARIEQYSRQHAAQQFVAALNKVATT